MKNKQLCGRPGGRELGLAALACLLPGMALAGIVELEERRDFVAATGATPLSIESFDYLADGPAEAPMLLSNGVIFSSAQPWVVATFGGMELTANTISAPRTFMMTEPGINVFGMDLFMQESDEYNVTVTTVGGDTLTIAARRGDKFRSFFGVRITNDALLSITFTALGGSSGPGADGAGIGNYAFDNVAVGTVTETAGTGTGGSGKRDRNRNR